VVTMEVSPPSDAGDRARAPSIPPSPSGELIYSSGRSHVAA
jgi:hypothetical protein